MTKSSKPLVNVHMDEDFLERLDDFRFSHRFPSRAAAMKYLIETRLEQDPRPTREEAERYNGHRLAS